MTAGPTAPINDFLRTFFRTRSLWQTFGIYWASMALVLMFWTLSLYLLPAYYYIPFGALCVPLVIGIILYRKKNPGFLMEQQALLQSGTLAQKLGVYFFIIFIFGPLGWGLTVFLAFWIYARIFDYAINPRYTDVIGYSIAFSCVIAVSTWIGTLANRNLRLALTIALFVLLAFAFNQS